MESDGNFYTKSSHCGNLTPPFEPQREPAAGAPELASRPEMGTFKLKVLSSHPPRALREIQPGEVDPATLVFGPQASGTASPDTAAASAWPGGWWRQERPARQCSAKAGGGKATWCRATPGARRSGRPSSG